MIDAIFTVGSIIFIIGLLPACLGPKTQIPLRTSIPTAAVLLVYAGTFAVMGLQYSAFFSAATAGMWIFLAIDRST